MTKFRKTIVISIIVVMALIGISIGVSGSRDDIKEYAVIISEDAKETEIFAAQVLSDYLSEISSKKIPVISDPQPFDGYGFYVGDTSAFDASDMKEKTDGSYALVPFDNGLAIYGSGTRGTIYGVFGFLEDFCGYRCFTASMGMQSITRKITLPDKKITVQSCFEFTDTDWRSPLDSLYSLANGLNGGSHRVLTAEQGGTVDYLGAYCHTLTSLFCSADAYFELHPEYFAFHDGERVPYQLCLTNEEVYNIVLSEVLEILEKEWDPDAELQIISLSQADNQYYCQCENCRSIDDLNGSQSGTIISFVNRIANAVKEKGYDNVAIDTFAYTYSRKAPSNVTPEDNVIVRLCTLEGCFSHALNDPDCHVNRKIMNDLNDWNKICDRLYIWDYTTNYTYSIGIFPDFHVLQANMQCFYEHGVKGVYEEGLYYISQCDTEFGELRAYLISRLLRDPYCDYEQEMKLFCEAYYGKGGPYIREFVDDVTDCSKEKHVSIYTVTSECFDISENRAEEFDKLWSEAESASAGDEETSAAIKRSKLSWRYVKACLDLREFQGHLAESMEAREELYDDLIAHGVKAIEEWGYIEPSFEPYRNIPVAAWRFADIIYILNYDANGGEDAPLFQWSNGYIVISDEVPRKEGYTFLGWSPDKNAEKAQYQPGDFFTLTKDLVLYAVWEKR